MKMREEDESNWFSRWEEQLPPPEELMPLSQTLISPDLALAFNILPNPNTHPPPVPPQNSTSAANFPPNHSNKSPEFENSGDYGSGATAGDESARTLKRPRLVWTPQLHKRFVDAVAHLGIKNAVPKTIMQLMSVDGLTRENVASHLQKYRLYLKRMQGLSGGGGNGGLVASSDPMDHLFASSPVPPHFLHPGRSSSDHYMPFVPVTALQHHQQQHHHHQHNMVSAVVHPQYNNQHRQSAHPFLRQQLQLQQQQPVHRTMPGDYSEDLESSAQSNGGRKVLTLFPSGA